MNNLYPLIKVMSRSIYFQCQNSCLLQECCNAGCTGPVTRAFLQFLTIFCAQQLDLRDGPVLASFLCITFSFCCDCTFRHDGNVKPGVWWRILTCFRLLLGCTVLWCIISWTGSSHMFHISCFEYANEHVPYMVK